MFKKTSLVIDDLQSEASKYGSFLKSLNYDVFIANSQTDAKKVLESKHIDLVLTDMHLSRQMNAEGLEIIRFVNDNYPQAIIIAMSTDPDLQLATRAMELGAINFLTKPICNIDALAICIDASVNLKQLNEKNRRIEQEESVPKKRIEHICPDGIHISDAERKMISSIAKNKSVPVCILGETGTGKEEIAKLIHKRRVEQEGNIPLISVNCAHLTGDLVLSALFGHKKGAFSGADKTTSGYIGEADGGILFLDEIHALDIPCQQKLLRVLNDGTYTRVGDTIELRSLFQTIIATTVDLDHAVADGRFLLDLRMRLAGVDLKLKPLRERKDDILTLVQLFFARKPDAAISNNEMIKIAKKCEDYYWQGNIRQLFKVLENLLLISTLHEIPIKAENMIETAAMFAPTKSSPKHIPTFQHEEFEEIRSFSVNEFTVQLEKGKLDTILNKVEKKVISYRLEKLSTVKDVYESLGISRSALDVKRKKYKL